MKEFVIRLLVAVFLTFAALALSSSARGQSAEERTNTATSEQQPQISSRAIRSNPIDLETTIECPNSVSRLSH